MQYVSFRSESSKKINLGMRPLVFGTRDPSPLSDLTAKVYRGVQMIHPLVLDIDLLQESTYVLLTMKPTQNTCV